MYLPLHSDRWRARLGSMRDPRSNRLYVLAGILQNDLNRPTEIERPFKCAHDAAGGGSEDHGAFIMDAALDN